ncbi:uncharacterized protein V1510DRAFT_216170 [Dipodascopsis tothii]|uniref:uncharacterized protein n=1 Tax=Dipodascopsis tothii TaxID=44089 RepID=UPI0034CF3BEC
MKNSGSSTTTVASTKGRMDRGTLGDRPDGAADAAQQGIGCAHVRQLLSSPSKDIALKSYQQAVRVAYDVRQDPKKLATFRVKQCTTCHEVLTTTFMCLQCYHVGCRKGRHSEAHYKKEGHMFGVDSSSGHLYCFACRDYVYSSAMEKAKARKEATLEAKKLKKRRGAAYRPAAEEAVFLEHNTRMAPCRPGLRGFQNMGATCFMSVILQSLIHNPIIRNDFLSGGHNSRKCRRENCLSCRIDEIFTEFFTSPETTGFGPASLLNTAWKTQRSLAGYSEQDAHEFLQFILDQLHSTSDVKSSAGAEYCGCLVHRAFRGQLASDIICPGCKNVTSTIDPLMDLSLELRDRRNGSKVLSLQECLTKFTSPEKLETKYHCSNCSTQQEVTKQLLIKRLPLVLSIQFKRFEHAAKSNKITDHVPFPMEIDMAPYTRRSAAHPSKPYIYELFGIVCHQGKINTGHYTCYMKSGDGKWFYFDDAVVTLVSEKSVLVSNAYLLFYIVKDLS